MHGWHAFSFTGGHGEKNRRLPWNFSAPSDDPEEKALKREELARELLTTCPPAWLADYRKIAQALRKGLSGADILSMEEVIRLPGTYAWLAERL